MSTPTVPSPSPSPSTAPPSATTPAPDVAARSKPGPTPSATPSAGTPPAGTTPPAGSPPAKPEESEGTVALRLVREQRERAKAEKERDELRTKLKAIEAEGDPFKRAKALWQEKKYRQATKTAFGVERLDDDFLVEVAGGEDEPLPLTEEQLTAKIRAQLEAERKAHEETQAAQLQELRAAAVQEVGGVLVASPEKWPTVWALGIRADALAEAIDASYDRATGQTLPPDKLFDKLEADFRAKIQGLPWLPKAPEPTPAPRSFGSESRKGPVDQPDPTKPPTFAERQKLREQREREWRATRFGTQT